MPTTLAEIEFQTRQTPLLEPIAKFWTSIELIAIINRGIKDLWRDIVDLKQEHFLTIDNTNVSLKANSFTLTGVPNDVHKVYLIEPRDLSQTSANGGLTFKPKDFNNLDFQAARGMSSVDPTSNCIFYAVHQQGAPVAAPEIRIAPKVSSAVDLSFCYVPTLATLPANGVVPIPGEADNALIAWTTAFARSKERDDRTPDPGWLAIYATEKQHLLQSLGLRQYQEPIYVDAVFESYWS